jgi:hypothetical protein
MKFQSILCRENDTLPLKQKRRATLSLAFYPERILFH